MERQAYAGCRFVSIGEDRSFIMLDMSVENPYSVVFHEYAIN